MGILDLICGGLMIVSHAKVNSPMFKRKHVESADTFHPQNSAIRPIRNNIRSVVATVIFFLDRADNTTPSVSVNSTIKYYLDTEQLQRRCRYFWDQLPWLDCRWILLSSMSGGGFMDRSRTVDRYLGALVCNILQKSWRFILEVWTFSSKYYFELSWF